MQAPVAEGADQVHVARADFIERPYRADKETPFGWNLIIQPLPQEHMQPCAGGERIVPLRVILRLPPPIIVAEDGVEVQAAGQRHGGEVLVHPEPPGTISLLEGQRDPYPVCLVFRYKAYQHVGRPLVAPAVIPPHAEGHQSHATVKLHHLVGGYQGAVYLDIPLQPAVIPVLGLSFPYRVLARSACRVPLRLRFPLLPGKQQDKQAQGDSLKIQRLHNYNGLLQM